MPHSNDSLLTDWTETATWYAERYGWEVIPLHPNPKFSEESSRDEVVRHVGYAPLWDDWEERATSDLEELKEWSSLTRGSGKCLPHVHLGVKTGRASNLLVLEVALNDRGRNQIARWKRTYGSLPETLVLFEERNRKFYAFTYPEVEGSLPQWFGGPSLRIHGASSLIRVPILNKRRSKLSWDLQGPEEPAAPPSWLIDHARSLMPDTGATPPPRECRQGSPPNGPSAEAPREAPPAESPSSTDASPASHSTTSSPRELPFQTGDELVCDDDSALHFLGHPWLVEDGLTVLTGAPKLAGKTTWTLNVAAHLASGRDFMGFPSRSCSVVVLTDVSQKWTQALLDDLEVRGAMARSRLHILTPKEVSDWHWGRLLEHTFRYAENVGAEAIFLDSLDQYVSVQGGPDPTSDDRVLHQLRGQPPAGSAVFAVKALQAGPSPSLRATLDELSDLGTVADVVIQMARVQASGQPTLRRFRSLARVGRMPREMYGKLKQGRYERLRRERMVEDDWVPAASDDASSRDARSPAPPLRTQDLEETTSIN